MHTKIMVMNISKRHRRATDERRKTEKIKKENLEKKITWTITRDRKTHKNINKNQQHRRTYNVKVEVNKRYNRKEGKGKQKKKRKKKRI